MNLARFPKEKHQNSKKMGEIHELFVLAISLVWFAGATPDRGVSETFFPCLCACAGLLCLSQAFEGRASSRNVVANPPFQGCDDSSRIATLVIRPHQPAPEIERASRLTNVHLSNVTFSLPISENFWVSFLFSASAMFFHPPTNVLKILRSLGKPRKSQKSSLMSKDKVVPDTFKILRHVMRAIFLFGRPKCSHRCVSLTESSLKPQARGQNINRANVYENEMV